MARLQSLSPAGAYRAPLSFHSPWIYTMNRCAQLSLALAVLAPAVASAQGFVGPTKATPVAPVAQSTTDSLAVQRRFAQNALRGKIVFGMPPVITMNGVVTRMAPAYRIHGFDNLLLMSAPLDGMSAVVNYTTDVEDHVLEVWILTPAEIANLWPASRTQAANWIFDPVAQTWTKP